jgi:hypothetical protein
MWLWLLPKLLGISTSSCESADGSSCDIVARGFPYAELVSSTESISMSEDHELSSSLKTKWLI